MITGENIVCISSHYWHEPWFRKQHFMSRFAKENRVLYVEPSFSMARRPPKRVGGDIATNRFFKAHVETVSDNLFLLKPPRGLPKWSYPTISKVNYIWFAKIIDKAAKGLGMSYYILWVYRPEYFPALKYFNYKKLVFDLTDDLAAYGGKKDNSYRHKTKCINNLIEKSNLVVVTAKTLFKRYQNSASGKIFHIPNGVDLELFSKPNKEVPLDLRNIKRPIIGFVGVLFNLIDYDLITYLADKNKDYSVVLVGPIEPWGTKESIEKLKKRKNIYLLGKKNKEKIPSYVSQFDVCINPFKVDQVSRSVNPLKVYEYLACGKPVVSVKMKALKEEEVGKMIDFASDYKDFGDKIEFWLANDSQNKKRDRINMVVDYSWENLFLELKEACSILEK